MGRRVRSWFLLAAVSCVVIAEFGEAREFDRPPNVLWIVVDDLGYGDLGCYGAPGNPTPVIDRFANAGVRFTDFHSAGPMCTPTRVSLLTGCYQQRFGRAFDGPLSGTNDRHRGLPLAARTIAEALRDAGYATGCFGKWHLGYDKLFLPTRQGFDTFRGLTSGDGDHHSHVDREGNLDWWRDERREQEQGYTTELLTQHAVDFIDEHATEPFFVYLPHLAIHFPWQSPDDPPHREPGRSYHDDKWGHIPNPADVRPHIRGMLRAVDASTSRLLATLDRHEIRQHTVVFLVSDNGGYLNYGKTFQQISSNGPLRGQKGMLYEGGHRVPLIVSWPGEFPPAVCDAMTHSNDLFVTTLGLTGAPVTQQRPDGLDLGDVLKRGAPLPQRSLFWRAGNEWAVREGPWKLVYEQEQLQLFDLRSDLQERRPLNARFPDRVRALRASWLAWEAEVERHLEAQP